MQALCNCKTLGVSVIITVVKGDGGAQAFFDELAVPVSAVAVSRQSLLRHVAMSPRLFKNEPVVRDGTIVMRGILTAVMTKTSIRRILVICPRLYRRSILTYLRCTHRLITLVHLGNASLVWFPNMHEFVKTYQPWGGIKTVTESL